jgi:hypothetical protein
VKVGQTLWLSDYHASISTLDHGVHRSAGGPSKRVSSTTTLLLVPMSPTVQRVYDLTRTRPRRECPPVGDNTSELKLVPSATNPLRYSSLKNFNEVHSTKYITTGVERKSPDEFFHRDRRGVGQHASQRLRRARCRKRILRQCSQGPFWKGGERDLPPPLY